MIKFLKFIKLFEMIFWRTLLKIYWDDANSSSIPTKKNNQRNYIIHTSSIICFYFIYLFENLDIK